MRLLLTRPQRDSVALAARLAQSGHDSVIAPLLHIVPVACPTIALDGVQTILATSSNGVRAFAMREEAARARAIPLLTVGDATAQTARELGFANVESARGDVESLTALVLARTAPHAGRLLHIGARDRAGDMKGSLGRRGYHIDIAVLYHAEAAAALPEPAAAALRRGDLDATLLYSPRTARIYGALAAEADLLEQAARITHYCLSEAVAREVRVAMAGAPVAVAAAPEQDALLALLG